MKDLAILIPVFNDQEDLIRTLDSMRESDNSFTVVVVDDGSEEAVEVDHDRYPFKIVVRRLQQNAGIITALNAGLKYILDQNFAFVARMDAADLNRPRRFEKQYQRLSEASKLQMVGANAIFRNEADNSALFETDLPLDDKSIKKAIVFRTCFIHPTVMIRTECLKTTGLYDRRYRHIEDFVFFSRIVEKFPCENLKEVLVECAIRESGISTRNHRKQLLSGIRYQLLHPKMANPRWYAYLIKRVAYFVVPVKVARWIKIRLGISCPPHTNQSQPSASSPLARFTSR